MARLKLLHKKQSRLHSTVLIFTIAVMSCNAEQPVDEKTVTALHEVLTALQGPSGAPQEVVSVPSDNVVPTVSPVVDTLPIAPSADQKIVIESDPVNTAVEQNRVVESVASSVHNGAVQATGEEIKSIEEEKVDEKIGIDTINLAEPQGNWLYKSIWYERAQGRYEDVRGFVDRIWELRTSFFNKRAELDRTVLDPFYISIGLRLGELQEVLSDLVGKFDTERKKDGDLNIQERSLLKEVKSEQLLIEKLNVEVKTVADLDHSIDDALNKLMEELNKVRMYEKDAWNNFKKISQVLSDTKARELYYAMDIQMRNIKDIQKYIQNDFSTYFNGVVNRISDEIKKIKNSIDKLKEQGVDFKMQADLLFTSINNGEEKSQLDSLAVQQKEDDQESVEKKSGLMSKVASTLKNILYLVVSPFTLLYRGIFG